METNIAKAVSVVFQPLLIPTYTLLILFNLNNYFSMLVVRFLFGASEAGYG